MGIYLNPGNENFREAVNAAIYVDTVYGFCKAIEKVK